MIILVVHLNLVFEKQLGGLGFDAIQFIPVLLGGVFGDSIKEIFTNVDDVFNSFLYKRLEHLF